MMLTIAGLSLLCGACTTTLKTAGDSWLGAPVSGFVAKAGVPQASMDIGDGRIAYTWYLDCQITMIARAGLIENWSSTNCANFQPVPGSWIREPSQTRSLSELGPVSP